ncbi:MAG: hypothetical protein ACLVEF_06625 [Bifidobacterium bifidum]
MKAKEGPTEPTEPSKPTEPGKPTEPTEPSESDNDKTEVPHWPAWTGRQETSMACPPRANIAGSARLVVLLAIAGGAVHQKPAALSAGPCTDAANRESYADHPI